MGKKKKNGAKEKYVQEVSDRFSRSSRMSPTEDKLIGSSSKRKSISEEEPANDQDKKQKLSSRSLFQEENVNIESQEKRQKNDVDKGCLSDVNAESLDIKEQNLSLLEERLLENTTNDSLLIPLLEDEIVTIYGAAKIRSLFGTVCVLGYVISPSDNEIDIYSPDCLNYLTISNASNFKYSELKKHHNDKMFESINNEETKIKLQNVLQCVECTAVIELMKVNCSTIKYIKSFSNFAQLFSGTTKKGCDANIVFENIGLEIVQDKSANCIEIPDDFMDVQNGILQYHRKVGRKNARIALCGGKNVGKSTMCRYLLNTLLNSCSEIAFLECDVGQTEFTPSGCISLTIVRKPVLGPPFTHLRQPESCCFYASLTPADDPEEYLRCVEHVHAQYLTKYSHLPLIINTMGWNKGIGISLLVDTLQIVQPNFIVQLDSSRQYRNLPFMSAEFVKSIPPWLTELKEVSKDELDYKTILLQSQVDKCLEQHVRFSAADHRTLTMLAYMGSLGMNVNAAVPYSIAWSSVAIYVKGVPQNEVMYALNCSVVGLCVMEKQSEEDDTRDDGLPKFLTEIPRGGSVGFGIVRGIDPVKKLFYIITPVSSHILQSVNAIVRGALEVPQQMLLKQKAAGDADIPYIGHPKDTVGATSTKPRRHMVRHFSKHRSNKD